MGNIFGPKKTTKEIVRENQRVLKRGIREMERDIAKLEQDERKMMGEARKLAKNGQQSAAMAKAKQIKKSRMNVKKFVGIKSNFEAMNMVLTTVKMESQLTETMKGTAEVLAMVNEKTSVKEMSGVVKQFMKEREKMEMQSDMMGDAMEDAFEDDDEMEGEDDILQDIMSEIVAEKSAGMATAPVMGVPAAAAAIADPVVSDAAQDELSARFENLRR